MKFLYSKSIRKETQEGSGNLQKWLKPWDYLAMLWLSSHHHCEGKNEKHKKLIKICVNEQMHIKAH